MTPSFKGRTATMLAGVRPTMRLASEPTARGRFVLASMATTDGSWMTMPFPRTRTRVLAVPRSIPISRENRPIMLTNGLLGMGSGRAAPIADHVVARIKEEDAQMLVFQAAHFAARQGGT